MAVYPTLVTAKTSNGTDAKMVLCGCVVAVKSVILTTNFSAV